MTRKSYHRNAPSAIRTQDFSAPSFALEADAASLLVTPAVAIPQMELERPVAVTEGDHVGGVLTPTDSAGATGDGSQPANTEAESPAKPRRYHGSAELSSTRVGRDAGKIADEVISHLVGLVGSSVRVTLEIEADIPDGAPDHVVRTVTENSRTLKFTSHGFENA